MECTACHSPNVDGARFCQKCGAPLPVRGSESDPLIGKTIAGQYRVMEVIGEGGMGRVYVAEQQMGTKVRKVAIKTLLAQFAKDHNTVGRFMREAGTISELEHPNTIKVFAFGQVDGTGEIYVAMEFLQGQSLEQALLQGPIQPDRVDHILKQVCGSLAEAHEKGIVHRDLKPANIFLTTRAGEQDVVKVLDFGIAKTDDKDSQQKLTQQGTILGTPPYMSPEQFTGKQLDARSDVYSLAVVAYEMLTGRLPFEADTPWEWATQHMTARPFPFEATPIGSHVPEKMRHAIMRALNKDREQRHQNVREFFDDVTLGAAGQRLSMVGSPGTSMPSMPGMPGPITGSMQSARGGGTQIGAPAFGGPPGGTMDGGGVPAPMGAPGVGGGYGAPAVPAPPPAPMKRSGGGGSGAIIGIGAVALLAVVGGGIFFAMKGGDDEKDPDPIPVASSSATPVLAETATTSTGGAAADPTLPATDTTGATPTSPTGPTTAGPRPSANPYGHQQPTSRPASGGNLDGCCAGERRRDKKQLCNSINQRVKSGQTSRADGVNAVRAQGIKCN